MQTSDSKNDSHTKPVRCKHTFVYLYPAREYLLKYQKSGEKKFCVGALHDHSFEQI